VADVVDSLSIENERMVESGPTAIVLDRLVLHGRVQGPIVSRAYSTCQPEAVARGLC
jgi:hypothetical protein